MGEGDEYAVHLSFKGKRDPEFFVRALGRLPRQHMSYSEKLQYLERNGLLSLFDNNPDELDRLLEGTKYLPGTNRDSVCILTAKDRSGNLFIKPTCVGGITSSNVHEQFKDRFAEDSIMVTEPMQRNKNCMWGGTEKYRIAWPIIHTSEETARTHTVSQRESSQRKSHHTG